MEETGRDSQIQTGPYGKERKDTNWKNAGKQSSVCPPHFGDSIQTQGVGLSIALRPNGSWNYEQVLDLSKPQVSGKGFAPSPLFGVGERANLMNYYCENVINCS